jgi:hypothetical protein
VTLDRIQFPREPVPPEAFDTLRNRQPVLEEMHRLLGYSDANLRFDC